MYCADCAIGVDASTELVSLRTRVTSLEGVLLILEWSDVPGNRCKDEYTGDSECCPVCHGCRQGEGHTATCALGAALSPGEESK